MGIEIVLTSTESRHYKAELPRASPGRAACQNSVWRVVQSSESRLTEVAARRVAELGYEVYVPQFPVWMRVNLGSVKQPASWHWRPRFFEFFFARFAQNDPWGEIIHQPTRFGIRRVLGQPGQNPHCVPDQLVQWLQMDQAQRAADIDAELARKARLPGFKPGQLVVVKTTPIGQDEFGADRYHHLAGQVLTVESCNGRTTTGYITLFNRRVPAHFARSELSDE